MTTPMTSTCPFCAVASESVLAQNAHALAIRDAFPVNPGHTLVVPRRHVASWFEISAEERLAILDLIEVARDGLDRTLRPAGYNIGINIGVAAGQTVMHLHVHLIPRFSGDVDEPSGGVRFVIPQRGDYRHPGRVPRTKE